MTDELKPSDERIMQLILMLDAPAANIGGKSAEELQILLQELLNTRTSGMVLVPEDKIKGILARANKITKLAAGPPYNNGDGPIYDAAHEIKAMLKQGQDG